MPFKIIRNDITKMNTDAIVNAANAALAPGGGVCGAIFSAAGFDALKAECDAIGGCKTGNAVITKGYNLPAKYIIHTVGPIYTDGNRKEAAQLYSCYKSSLKLAKKRGLESIAFPLVSSGIYGYPKNEALQIATNAIVDFLAKNDMEIYLVVYDKNAFEVSTGLFSDVKAYIDETMVHEESLSQRMRQAETSQRFLSEQEHKEFREQLKDYERLNTGALPDMSEYYDGSVNYERSVKASMAKPMAAAPKNRTSDIADILRDMDKSFSETLLDLIDKSGMKDSAVYKKANVDRRLFSKIRSDVQYKPSKVTAVAFALALELDWFATCDLLEKAGYSMTHSSKFDIIIEYFIKHKNYNVYEINEVLFAFDQSLIGV